MRASVQNTQPFTYSERAITQRKNPRHLALIEVTRLLEW
jgi:hypothetical protein